MTYSERHKWCTGKIVEAFSPELTLEAAQEFFRQNTIIQQLNVFFKGDGPGRLFVSYQSISHNNGDVSIFIFVVVYLLFISIYYINYTLFIYFNNNIFNT